MRVEGSALEVSFQERDALANAQAEGESKGGRWVSSVDSMQSDPGRTYGDYPPALHLHSRQPFPTEFFVVRWKIPCSSLQGASMAS